MQISVIFAAVAPPEGKTLDVLRIKLTDAGNAVHEVNKTLAQVTAGAMQQPDGRYLLNVEFTNLGVGPFTVTAQALDVNGSPLSAAVSGSGTVTLADGVWIPSPVSIGVA